MAKSVKVRKPVSEAAGDTDEDIQAQLDLIQTLTTIAHPADPEPNAEPAPTPPTKSRFVSSEVAPKRIKKVKGKAKKVKTGNDVAEAVTFAPAPLGVFPDEREPRRSRFFFRLSKSWADELDLLKREASSPQRVINDITGKNVKKLKRTMPPKLSVNIEQVKDHFLNVIMPLASGVDAGMAQAQDAIQSYFNTEVEALPFVQFETMARAAARYKMAQMLVRYFKLPKGSEDILLETVIPKQMVMFPPLNQVQGDGPAPSQARKPKKAKKAREPQGHE